MKKTLSILFVAALFATALSCNKEIAEQPVEAQEEAPAAPVEEGLVPMSFSADFSGATKAVINDDGTAVNMIWAEGDKLAVYDGTAIREFTLTEGAGTSSAKFEGLVAEGATEFKAIHPYTSSIEWDATNSQFTGVVIPEVQCPAVGGVDPAALVCVADQPEDGTFSFTNVLALIKIDMQQDDFEDFEIHNSAMNGTAGTIAVKTDGSSSWITKDKIAISVNPEGAKGVYYVGYHDGNYTGGISIVAHKEGARAVAARATANILAGCCYDFGTFTGATWCPDVITTAAELRKFSQIAYYAYLPSETVKLGADIDLDGEVWTPVSRFYATFDGQNHKIYNIVTNPSSGNVGFIATLGNNTEGVDYGHVKNVCFGSSDYNFSTKTGTYDGKSSFTLSFKVGDWSYVGSAVGYASVGTSLDNVVNFASVNVADSIDGQHRSGGIAGTMKGSVSITNCINFGTVIDNATSAGSSALNAIAGIVGSIDGENTLVENCINKGVIKNQAIATCHIGGIAGLSNYACNVKGCVNNGAVTNDAQCYGVNTGYGIRVGGILGASTKEGSVVDKCSNTGKIDQPKASSRASTGLGGIIGVVSGKTTLKGCSNSGVFGMSGETVVKGAAMGGIVGYVTGCSIVITKADDGTWNTNTANYNHGTFFSLGCYAGGIVGYDNKWAADGVIEYCRNSGKIACSSKQAQSAKNANYVNLGGICAASRVSIRNCENSGIIHQTAADNNQYFRSGGITGYLGNEGTPEITDCINTGTIQVGKGYGSAMYCAGIAGIFYANGKMKGCTNTGEILVSRGNTVFAGALVSYFCYASSGNLETPIEDCTVNNNFRYSEYSIGYYDTEKSTQYGLGAAVLIGRIGGTSTGPVYIGSAAKPIKVGGKFYQYLSTGDTLLATLDNLADINARAIGTHSGNLPYISGETQSVFLNAAVL